MIRNYFKDWLQLHASDWLYAQINYNYLRLKFRKIPRIFNIANPRTFSEWIVHLKMNYRPAIAHIVADKFAVRDYVERRVGSDILIPLYGTFKDFSELDVKSLPDQFVAKPNHASGKIFFSTKNRDDLKKLEELGKKWLSQDYGAEGREYQYSLIPRRVVIEQDMRLLDDSPDLVDFKFFCFDGQPQFVQVDLDRYQGHKRNFYDLNWKRIPVKVLFPNYDQDPAPPVNLRKMIEIAKRLSEGLRFARVDLYEIQGKVYFGEITLHPGGGLEPIWPERYDALWGEYFNVNQKIE